MSRDLVGKVVGAYRLGEIARWGQGPSATVYEAEHAASGNKVAVKVYSADFSKDKNIAARLTAEVQRATLLKHPNLAEVLDVGTTEHKGKRHLFVVTEWLRGETLQMRLAARKQPLPLTLVLQIASDVGAALQALHRPGGAHRSLSAAAIFLAHAEDDLSDAALTAKLLDLGAANVEAAAVGETLPKANLAAREDLQTLARILQEALRKPDGQGPLRVQNPAVPVHVDLALAAAAGELNDGTTFDSPAGLVGALLGVGSAPSAGPWSPDGMTMPVPVRAGLNMGWVAVGGLALVGGVALWLIYREPQGPVLADLSRPAADLSAPAVPPPPIDQATSAPADQSQRAPADQAQPVVDLAAAPPPVEPATPEAEHKPRPKRGGPPIPPVRGPLAWNPELKFAAVAEQGPAKPAAVKRKLPKRTGPAIPPLRP